MVAPAHPARGHRQGAARALLARAADARARPGRRRARRARRPDALPRLRRDAGRRPLAHARTARSDYLERRAHEVDCARARPCTCSRPTARWRSGSGSSRRRSATSGPRCTSSSAARATASRRWTADGRGARALLGQPHGEIGPAVGATAGGPRAGGAGRARPGGARRRSPRSSASSARPTPGGCCGACAGSASASTGRAGSCARCRCRASTATCRPGPRTSALSEHRHGSATTRGYGTDGSDTGRRCSPWSSCCSPPTCCSRSCSASSPRIAWIVVAVVAVVAVVWALRVL